jgi:hypothetical protein
MPNVQRESSRKYTLTIEETNDGTGDGIITFPDEIIEQLGWYENMPIKMVVEGNTLVITKL